MAINVFWELKYRNKEKWRWNDYVLGRVDFASEAPLHVTCSDCLILSVVDWRGTLTRWLDHKDLEIISEKNSVMNSKLNWALVGVLRQKIPFLFFFCFLVTTRRSPLLAVCFHHIVPSCCKLQRNYEPNPWDYLHKLTICPLCHFLLGILSWWWVVGNWIVQVGSILSMEWKKPDT